MGLNEKLQNRTTRLTGLSPGVAARESGPGRRDGETLQVPPKSIVPDPDQPRKTFDEAGLASLAASLKEHGVINPLTVREEADGAIRLIAGERRLRAALLAGLETVPCRFDQSGEPALLQLVENVQRQDLNPIEEAEAYVRLKELGYTLERIGRLVGRSKSLVSETAALASLPANIKASARRQPDKFPKRLLIDLTRQKDPDIQAGAAERAASGELTSDQLKVEGREQRQAETDPEARLNSALHFALHRTSGAEERWEKRRQAGLTDQEVKECLRMEFGLDCGGSLPDGGWFHTTGVNPPRVWLSWKGLPNRSKPPTLQGRALVEKVRDVLGIPQPVQREKPTRQAEARPLVHQAAPEHDSTPSPGPEPDQALPHPDWLRHFARRARIMTNDLASLDRETLAEAMPDDWEDLLQALNELYRGIEALEG